MNLKSLSLDNVHIEKHIDIVGGDLYHFSAIDPETDCRGFGTDHDESVALKKAFNEMIERIHWRHYSHLYNAKSTSGFAVHDNSVLAQKNALAELIERDAFLSNWLIKQSPNWIPRNSLPNTINKRKINWHFFESMGGVCQIGILKKCFDHTCVVGVLYAKDKQEFGGVFSSAANIDINLAIQSVYFELRRAALMIKGRKKSQNTIWKDFDEDEVKTASDHLEFYLNPINFANLDWFFENSEEVSENREDINFHHKDLDLILSPPWPIAISFVDSDEVQKFFVGPTRDEKINLKKFSLDLVLNRELHPLP